VFKINKIFNYWLIPTDANRWFPKRGIIMPKHINGGFTYVTHTHVDTHESAAAYASAATEYANIFIYRREEFPKVMIHELMHHSYVDITTHTNTHTNTHTHTHNNLNIYENNAFINKLKMACEISTNTQFLPNEGIIEAWALILHSLFISLEYKIPFNTIMGIEKTWSTKQSARLLYYKNIHKNDKKNEWEETTNSYCYIVIKTLLIQNIDACINNSINGTIQLYIEKNIANYLEKLIPQNLKNKTFRITIFGDL
jgi:hypothetical protein